MFNHNQYINFAFKQKTFKFTMSASKLKDNFNYKNSNCSQSWSQSKVTSFSFSHCWKIDHFSEQMVPKDSRIDSPVFSGSSMHDVQFQLTLRPQVSNESNNEKTIALFIRCIPGSSINNSAVTVHCNLALLKNDGTIGTSHGKF